MLDGMKNNNPSGGTLTVLRSNLPNLTKKEQKVALVILKNPSDVIHMSITELAEISGTAEATVFRFCKALNFSGFQSFKISLARDLFPSEELIYHDVELGDAMLPLTAKIFQSVHEGLQDTLNILDPVALEEAVRAVLRARRIYAFAYGVSFVVALDIEYRFIRFDVPVKACSDPHMQVTYGTLMTPDDLVIAISHTGSNRDLLQALEPVKDQGAKILAVTSHLKSPLSAMADITLCGMGREVNYRSDAMASRLVHMAILDALYVGAMIRNKEPLSQNMDRIRTVISQRKT